LTKLGTDT